MLGLVSCEFYSVNFLRNYSSDTLYITGKLIIDQTNNNRHKINYYDTLRFQKNIISTKELNKDIHLSNILTPQKFENSIIKIKIPPLSTVRINQGYNDNKLISSRAFEFIILELKGNKDTLFVNNYYKNIGTFLKRNKIKRRCKGLFKGSNNFIFDIYEIK